MVHHALAPGQSGNSAQRRLYVDLIAFPADGLPRLAQGAPAAALAESVLYENAHLPSQPEKAYLYLLHQVGRHWPHVDSGKAVSDAQLSCRDLARRRGPGVELALQGRGLTEFQSYLVEIYSAKYFCPQNEQLAVANLGSGLLAGQ